MTNAIEQPLATCNPQREAWETTQPDLPTRDGRAVASGDRPGFAQAGWLPTTTPIAGRLGSGTTRPERSQRPTSSAR